MFDSRNRKLRIGRCSSTAVADWLGSKKGAQSVVLTNARIDGELAEAINIDDLASSLAMSVVGISALIRANAPSEQVHAAARAITAQIG